MKLHEFLKQLEGYSGDLEVGIGYDGHFVGKLQPEFAFVNDDSLKTTSYYPSRNFKSGEHYNTKILILARIAEQMQLNNLKIGDLLSWDNIPAKSLVEERYGVYFLVDEEI